MPYFQRIHLLTDPLFWSFIYSTCAIYSFPVEKLQSFPRVSFPSLSLF